MRKRDGGSAKDTRPYFNALYAFGRPPLEYNGDVVRPIKLALRVVVHVQAQTVGERT